MTDWPRPRRRVPNSCGWFMHDWDKGVDPGELYSAVVTNTILYTCHRCGKQKQRHWA